MKIISKNNKNKEISGKNSKMPYSNYKNPRFKTSMTAKQTTNNK